MADQNKLDNEVIEQEEEALKESEPEVLDKGDLDEVQAEVKEWEKGAMDVSDIPAEVAAVNTDNETAQEATEGKKETKEEKKETASSAVKQKPAQGKERNRSKRYQEVAKQVQLGQHYPIDEAIELVKNTASTKFESSVELHIKMVEKKGKKKGGEETLRGLFHLPHGLGKELKIIVMDENKIEEIAKTKKVDFDVAIATPQMMPKMGKVAKILGPKGKMPNPKFGTVTDNPEKVQEEISKGRVEYKVDASGVIHQMVGKVSWDAEKLKENILAILQSLAKKNVQSVVLSSTMGPGVRVEW